MAFKVVGALAGLGAVGGGCAPVLMDGDAEAGANDGGLVLVSDGGVSSAGDAGGDAGASSYIARVISFEPGAGAGFGQMQMPGIIQGPPQGRGQYQGSLDVLSLGNGGRICVGFDRPIANGPGADFVVFENAFNVLGTSNTFVELGEVSVSQDGVEFVTFACNREEASGYVGCAGVKPVLANASNGLNPLDPAMGGGDVFDLQSVGLQSARVVCIRDLATQPLTSPNSGFDLDSIGAIHREP